MNAIQMLKYVENGLIVKIVKLLALLTSIVCCFIFFIFYMTYMNTNNFFSYDLLSFGNLWIFIFALLASCIFSLFALPCNVIVYYHKKKKDVLYYGSWFIIFLYILTAFVVIMSFGIENGYWTGFCFFMGLVYFMLIEIGIDFYVNKKLRKILGLSILLLIFIIWVAITIPNLFNTAFGVFLTKQGLAAEKVEIYLKNKNKIVVGKMLFRDSKFAYVEYKDTIRIDNTNLEQSFSQSVPIEDVSILKDLR